MTVNGVSHALEFGGEGLGEGGVQGWVFFKVKDVIIYFSTDG